ncbi:MAG: aminopeptidase N [bacterium]
MTYRDATPGTIYLKDYQAPTFLIDQARLRVEVSDGSTRVLSDLTIRRNPQSPYKGDELSLDGKELALKSLAIDGESLSSERYSYEGETLRIRQVPDQFVLSSEVIIYPESNTALEGLFRSRTMYCTQCEAEGFRRITFFLDRPDVLSEFTTTIVADAETCPVLLSNGNLIDEGINEDGRHWKTWHDPFRKPAYLFALVAGDLQRADDSFTTQSGREVDIHLYVEPKDLDKCDHAITSLKNAMRWDEEVYGREYDLDIFMIVAVDDFNMGAMENKGLNIFNTSCVLAHPDTTTDMGFQRVEGVVAHEYFHNWSGNRVTCRDWFQLSLKEGFTVFRDSEFSADMGSRTVKRVDDVSLLRTFQFAQDGGPTAHPVQPASYMEISNFYTLTIYEKGSEVVRMIRTLLGAEKFREGSDLYFDRHDGEAATIEDFVKAMADVSGRDFNQFMNWYRQAGTPRLEVTADYDAAAQTYRMTFRQSCPPTPECAEKQPFLIPVELGLVGQSGDLPLSDNGETSRVLEITESVQTVEFSNITEKPVPSILRGFSAPVKVKFPYALEDLSFLIANDSDGFNRWDASQKLSLTLLEGLIEDCDAGREMHLDQTLIDAFEAAMKRSDADKAGLAQLLMLPSEAYLSEEAEIIKVEAIHHARQFVRREIGTRLRPVLLSTYQENAIDEPYQANSIQIGKRSLRNIALGYLLQVADETAIELARLHYERADNLTDRLAALAGLLNIDHPDARALSDELLAGFYDRWQSEALVVNQWFQMQAWRILPGGLERVQSLMTHPAFEMKNPNKVRAVIGAFTGGNYINFHREDGAGYAFLKEQVEILNSQNPQIASRLLTPLTKWRKYQESRANAMRQALEDLMANPALSRDVYEIVSKSLK